MRTIFITRSKLGLACLEELVELDADVKKIYTKPRESEISDQVSFESFVDNHCISIEHVTSVNHPRVISEIRAYEPELLFVVGWSELISEEVLDIPSVAALGMHPSPLPRGRGRAPIAWALIKGLDETALSCFHLVPKADAGDLVGQEQITIDLEDDAADLYDKVVSAGRSLIREYYPRFEDGEVPRTPQNENKATWWPKRTPDHGLIDWTRSAEDVYNWIRGQSDPYPGAFSYIGGIKVTVLEANLPSGERTFAPPGTILEKRDDTLVVAVWEEALEITCVRISEKERQPAATLLEQEDIDVGGKFTNAKDIIVEDK